MEWNQILVLIVAQLPCKVLLFKNFRVLQLDPLLCEVSLDCNLTSYCILMLFVQQYLCLPNGLFP